MRSRSQGGRGTGPRRPGRDGRPHQERSGPSGKAGKAGKTGPRSGSPKPAAKKSPERVKGQRPGWLWGPGRELKPATPNPTPFLPGKRDAASTAPPLPSAIVTAKPAAKQAAVSPPAIKRLAVLDELEVRIEKLVAGGEGLARSEGLPIFVVRAAPGDLLKVQIIERHADYARAEVVEVLEPGPDRRPDPYPELSATGICDLQHIRDEVQPRLKAAAVRETLERLGGVWLPQDTALITGAPWGYRLRTQIHTDVDPVAGGVRVGYYARRTRNLVPVTRCPVLVPELDAFLPFLRDHLAPGGPTRVDLAAGDGGEVTVSPNLPGLPHGEVSMQVGDLAYSYDARTFFQGHRDLLPRLVEVVVGEGEGELAFDLYGGVGLFALPLARRYRKVVLVEGDTQAARLARNNARRNKLNNVEVLAQNVETWVADLPDGVDRLVVDPPRSGLSPKVPRILMERRPKRLTYVSCHPATLARDLRLLTRIYRIESVAMMDLFPQTGHMEALVQMVLEPDV
jgi:23S rRNA (uracil1939-C5)-methyltransferase